jgi:hypothetical protein
MRQVEPVISNRFDRTIEPLGCEAAAVIIAGAAATGPATPYSASECAERWNIITDGSYALGVVSFLSRAIANNRAALPGTRNCPEWARVASSHRRPTRLRRFSDRDAGNDAARIAAAAVAEDGRALDAGGEAVYRWEIYEVKAIRARSCPRVSKSLAWIKDPSGRSSLSAREDKPTGSAAERCRRTGVRTQIIISEDFEHAHLAEIIDVVGDRIDVICDGGIRRGTHVLKALSLGAKACSGGRFYLYALAAAGQVGVERALQNLHNEIERDMKLMGCRSINELSRENLRFR